MDFIGVLGHLDRVEPTSGRGVQANITKGKRRLPDGGLMGKNRELFPAC